MLRETGITIGMKLDDVYLRLNTSTSNTNTAQSALAQLAQSLRIYCRQRRLLAGIYIFWQLSAGSIRHKILPGPQTFFLRGGGLPAAAVRELPVCAVVSVL